MLRHSDIWSAIDRLAHHRGLTASGLARRAGLDPTTFNKSKRVTREGKPRWPSTESIAKILDATGTSLKDFLALLPEEPSLNKDHLLPLVSSNAIHLAKPASDRAWAAGREHDEIFFGEKVEGAFAVEVADAALEPIYREGDILIVSPEAEVRRGDRVLMHLATSSVAVGEFLRRSGRRLTFRQLSTPPAEPVSLPFDEVEWQARILWASQ